MIRLAGRWLAVIAVTLVVLGVVLLLTPVTRGRR